VQRKLKQVLINEQRLRQRVFDEEFQEDAQLAKEVSALLLQQGVCTPACTHVGCVRRGLYHR
jgi:hypothetical protein